MPVVCVFVMKYLRDTIQIHFKQNTTDQLCGLGAMVIATGERCEILLCETYLWITRLRTVPHKPATKSSSQAQTGSKACEVGEKQRVSPWVRGPKKGTDE